MWKSKLFKRMPLQQKMMLSFALPVVIIAAIGMAVAFQKLYASSRTNIEFSANQTGQQAASFLESYYQTMSDISDLLEFKLIQIHAHGFFALSALYFPMNCESHSCENSASYYEVKSFIGKVHFEEIIMKHYLKPDLDACLYFKGGWKEKKDALLAELEADKEGTGDPLCRK